MKSMILLTVLMFSTFAQASSTCDLKANDQKVEALNEIFDRGEMRGEDHAIGLKFLYEERLDLIESCVANDLTGGISKQELNDTVENIDYKLQVEIRNKTELKDKIKSLIK